MTDGVTPSQSVVTDIVKVIRESNSCAICIPAQSSLDVVAAALALAEAVKQEGKTASIIVSQGIDSHIALHGIQAISREFTADGDTLKVVVPYTGSGIENVSYNIEEGKLSILITPEPGFERINTNDVQYMYTGGTPDVICTLYAPTLQALGDVYENNKKAFADAQVINIDTHFTNSSYGTLNLVDKDASCMSQLVNEILRELKTHISEDTARNLYDALMSATKNFTGHGVNAKTFRMAAFLVDHISPRSSAEVAPHIAGGEEQREPVARPIIEEVDGISQSTHSAPAPATEVKPIVASAPAVTAPGFQPASPIEAMKSPSDDAQLKPNIFQGAGMNKG